MIDPAKIWARYNGFSIAWRIVIALALLLLIVGIGIRASDALHVLIFGNTEAQRQHGNAVVAREQTKAEGKIADKAIQSVQERDVYREHVTEIVHDSQGKVNNAWKGESVGKDVDAAGAAALCRLHDSLCRQPPAKAVQPLR